MNTLSNLHEISRPPTPMSPPAEDFTSKGAVIDGQIWFTVLNI